LAPARKITKKRRRGPKRVVRKLRKVDRPKAPEPPPAVRPRTFSKDVAEALLDRVADGEPPTQICRDDPGMPTWRVLGRWRRQNEDFEKRFRIAWESCCEHMVGDIVTIADNATNDYVNRVTKKGVLRVFDREHFERSRLRVESRKWMAQKVLRAVYGERSEVDLRTPDGLAVKVEERNALIDSIVKLVSPKADGKTKPSGRTEEPRER
jgi:hypothetical protein